MAGLPITCNRLAHIKAFDCVGEIAHEITSSQLAVGKYLKPHLFLLVQNAADVRVFQGMKPGRILRRHAPRFQQLRRPEEAADMIGVNFGGRGHRLLFSFSLLGAILLTFACSTIAPDILLILLEISGANNGAR